MKHTLILLTSFLLCPPFPPLRAAETLLVDKGTPRAQIVIAAEKRPRMVTLAALELQYHLQKMSGARLPIVTSPDANLPVKIYVGKSAETERLGVKDDGLNDGAFKMVSGPGWIVLIGNDADFDTDRVPIPVKRKDTEALAKWNKAVKESGLTDAAWGFPFQGFIESLWSPKGFDKLIHENYGEGASSLWLTGGNTLKGFWNQDQNGSLNAVIALMRSLGVRWFMPGDLGEVLLKTASVTAGPFNLTVKPDYGIRGWMWSNYGAFGFEDVIWARRIGMAGGFGYHGLVNVYGNATMHKAHPEYYALKNGKRDTEHRGVGTPCFHSEGLLTETVNYCRFRFDKFDEKLVDIWPGDGLMGCECDKCKGKTRSELVWGFADRVAIELYKSHPAKRISCGAYSTYIEAPDTIVKFSPNLTVCISNSGRPKMEDPQHWAEYWARVQKWQSKLAPGGIIRGENNRYHIAGVEEDENGKRIRGKPISYPVIHPRAVARDLKALKAICSADSGEQSMATGKWQAMGVEHITLYVRSRFLWDASLDVDKVLGEYCALFYGPAAKQMKETIDFAENNLTYRDQSRGNGKGSLTNVSLDTALKFRDMLDKAKAAAGDTIYGQRVQAVISDLQPKDELIAKYKARDQELAELRAKAPLAVGIESADLSKATTYKLKANRGGKEAVPATTFKVGWDKNALLLDIHCAEPDMKKLNIATDVFDGDYLAVSLETPNHSYYHLEINPDGRIDEGDPAGKWKSLAEVKTEKGADFWRVQLRIPVVGDAEANSDPNHRVAGAKPTPAAPWFFNVGRMRLAGLEAPEQQAFSPTGGSWHITTKFGKLEIR
jgi:hypothetical protein